ncbi:COMM domain-containing protein 7 isoform 3-T3 [Trichechus inunguis]
MGRLYCTQDPVPEAVGGDMQQLNQLGAQQFSALTEVIFHFLAEPKEVERFLAQLSEFATTNQISLGPLRSTVKSLLLVPNGALKKSLTAEQVRADFITLGLSEDKATYFSEKWKQNSQTLAQWAIGQTLMINQLIDMEWKFGVTSGSSELDKVGSIFLQLPTRDGASQSQHGVFQLISVPLHLRLATLPSRGDCSERYLTHRPVGCSFCLACLLGAQV